jgi:hypothetical protein
MSIPSRIKSALKSLIGTEAEDSIRVNTPVITLEEIIDVKRFFSMPKFFIFGHARSGTTLLARMIRLHPEVHCNWQAHFFTRPPFLKSLVGTPQIEDWLTRKSNRWNHGRDRSPVILRVSADFILERDARSVGKSMVGDKSPSSLVAGEAVLNMAAVYPDAKMIYIVRDGRDVIISERMRNFIEDSKHLSREDRLILKNVLKDPAPFFNGQKSIFTEEWLSNNARIWVRNLEETEEKGRQIFQERYIHLKYEDLLERPDLEMERLWKFLEVQKVGKNLKEEAIAELKSNPDEEWQQTRNVEISSLFPKGRVGNWKHLFTKQDKSIFHSIAGSMLRKWGYEKNEDWA